MNAADILQTITLAVSAWTLHEVIAHGKKISAMEQRLEDLPCGDDKSCHE